MSVTEMALAGHTIESMVTRDRISPGLTSPKALVIAVYEVKLKAVRSHPIVAL